MGSDPIIRILAIDAGNTRIKWGVRDGEAWAARGAVATNDAQSLTSDWPALVADARAIACNVAGADVRAAIAAVCEQRGLRIAFIASEASRLGVTNGYRDPAQLGTDRWAALVAAHHASRGNKLVVNVGTALTVDALTADGRFLGGVIVPGPALMRRSLDRGTADLRLTEGAFMPFPTSTPDAITSGSIQACVGAIERIRAAMAAQGAAPDAIVLSGGAAAQLAPHLPMPAALNENLVLDGLVLIARDS
ncbi:type III pantothenate kinase [Usitatibacter palustris]|uniref:Type III pantothenate kinase n=1 Tax=Usitatibacter palustris TaxID=2732487 RepID=A0A6M4H303_9PROT|nr:type III pantothenate kinase [Usitatibacter palustris]QJR13820.1 Type III pantothenate kinase [Usitatibacter palustris]